MVSSQWLVDRSQWSVESIIHHSAFILDPSSFGARAGMVLVIRGAQVPISNVRVDLRRGDITMSQQRLDRTRISAAL